MSENLENITTEESGVGTSNEESTNTVTMTQEELDALIQRKSDQRVSQALKTMERKQREADKLRDMSADERRLYDLEQREVAIAAKERELALVENKSVCLGILAQKGLDPTLVDFVVDESADIMDSNIKLLDKAFKASVRAEVEKRLASKAPAKSAMMGDALTKEQFSRMSYAERVQLKQSDPDAYIRLSAM